MRARLEELSEVFLECRSTFHRMQDRYQWAPAPGSPAAAAATALPSPDPRVCAPSGETGHRLIAEVVQVYLLTATSHLGALASLYRSQEIISSTPLLVRAIIENCAHALWVLGGDPDEPAENRLARAYLEELLSAEEEKKNRGRLRGKTDEGYVRARARYKTLKRHIQAVFPGVISDEHGKPELNGQKLPRLEESVLWMYELTEAAGGCISQGTASGIYGYLSNLTHPTLYPSRLRRGWVQVPGSEYWGGLQERRIDEVESEARAALAPVFNAITYTISYFGWSDDMLSGLKTEIDSKIPSFFR